MVELFNTEKVIKLIYKYLEDWEKVSIIKVFNEGLDYIEIDLQDLETFSYNLVDLMRIYPIEMISLFENTITNFKENSSHKDIKVRFKNLPDCDKLDLSNIRIEHENKFVKFKGMIKRKSDVMPKIKATYYICSNPSCDYSEKKIAIPQLDDKLRKIKACMRCKSGVELVGETKTPFQQIIIEEDISEGFSNNQPKSKPVELEYDLTSPFMDNRLLVGSKVEVIGIVKSKHAETQQGKKTIGEFYIEANNIITLEENLNNIDITNEEKEQIIELSKRDDIEKLLINSIAPNIAGRTEQKLATCFYIVGGSEKQDKKSKLKKRSNIHIKIIGNASTGKSQILKWLDKFLPKSVYISAENASNAGIVGTVVRDEFTGQWAVEAGSMAMANGGYYLQDESDKLKSEELTKQNQALEDGKATINKAGIRAELKTDCPCFSVANPKNGRFNEDKDYIDQINFDPTYLSRFDLVFILDSKDADKEQDEVLNRLCELDSEDFETIDDDLLRKYLIYAKRFNPVMNKELKNKLINYYKQISAMAKSKNSIDITYRQFGGLIRMSEARAKLFLRNEVILEDVKAVIDLMRFTLDKLGLSEIETGISNSKYKLKELIPEIFNILQKKEIPCTMENIISEIESITTVHNKKKIEKMIEQMKIEGECYEPRKGVYKLI